MNRPVRTVLGDLPAEHLGRTDYHEHLLQVSPLLVGDELDDVDRSAEEAALLRDSGFDALVELTPIGLGRDPRAVREISRRTGIHVIMATGVHREAHYPQDHPLRRVDPEDLADRFVREIEDAVDADETGVGPSSPVAGVRAGVIKVGVGYWSISPFERSILEAAASAPHRSGVAVVCHLEMGTAGFEVLEVLTAAGVPADRVVLAHADRNPDPGLHRELCATGAYLGYDGPGRAKYWPDSVLIDCLITVAETGGSDRLLLGGDVARRSSFRSYGGLPGMAYLGQRFVPRLTAAGGETLVHQVLVTNPATVLALEPRETGTTATNLRRRSA